VAPSRAADAAAVKPIFNFVLISFTPR